ncbi:MAG: CHAT domain-containing tetratricopeptide repeat protein [Chitinophagales bacterium]
MSKQKELKLAKNYFEEGKVLAKAQKLEEAMKMYSQATAIYEEWEVWEDWVKTNDEIGYIYHLLDQSEKGIKHLQRVFEIGSLHLGKFHILLSQILYSLGRCYFGKGNYHLAIQVFQESLMICKKSKKDEQLSIAKIFYSLGNCYAMKNEFEAALAYCQDALTIYKKKLGDEHPDVAQSLSGLAYIHLKKGDYEIAIAHYQDMLTIYKKKLGVKHPRVAVSLNGLGNCFNRKKDYNKAIVCFKDALTIYKNSFGKTHPKVATFLSGLGNSYFGKGDYESAIAHFQEALLISKKSFGQEHPYTANDFNGLGICHEAMGNYELAIAHFEDALSIYQKNFGEEHPYIAGISAGLGNCYLKKGNYEMAIDYHQKSLAIFKKNLWQEKNEVMSLNNLGTCFIDKKEYKLAITYFKNALVRHKEDLEAKQYEIAHILRNLGTCYFSIGDYERSIHTFQKAIIAVVSSFNQKNIFENPTIQKYSDGYTFLSAFEGKAKTLYHIYKNQNQELKYLQAALSTASLATDLVSHIRKSYKAEGSKHTLAETTAKIFHQAIEIALTTASAYQQLNEIPQYPEFTNIPYTIEGAKNLAFDFAEQSKAVLLLSTLKDSEAKTASNIPSELLEKEEQLKIDLNYLDQSIAKQKALGGNKDEELLTKFQRQYFKQKQQYDALIEQFEADYPEYYQLKYSISTASVQDLQYYLSPRINSWATNRTNSPFEGGKGDVNTNSENNTTIKQSAILSYHIAEETIYIFAISSNDYQITTVEKPTDFSHLVEKLQGDIQLGSVNEFIQSSTQLFDVLLQPVWDFLQESSKLIIIPHGELYYVPFDVLLNQHQITDAKNFSDLPYLIRDFDISYHYSATLLLHNHQRQLQTSEQIDSFFGLAPVYFRGNEGSEKKEGYVVKSSGKQDSSRRRILKSSGDAQEALQDLEETELEVKEVYQLFEEQGKEAIALFYDQANKQNLQEYIGGYKYVLISTHGFLQEAGKNTLSGIHLASRQTEGDYILHASETYHLNLNADLVVLSSCESGVGELKVGEGMMALNRGFLYAGASNIVYSLFQVPQDSTSQLTQALFRYILEGENYAAALRKAKLGLIADEMMEPMDWAGFALVGG